MSYRPENWNEIIGKLVRWYDPKGFQGHYDKILLNAGADAMLEALKAQGRWIEAGVMPLFTHSDSGWLIFIPEEAK